MCTLVLHFQPESEWPLLVAGNRDEMRDRPWLPPGRHWPDRPEVRAGLDELAGGTWFGVSDHGVMASILNRRGTLGPTHSRRSRGELVLEALEHSSAEEAAEALQHLEPTAYRGFNLIVGDPTAVYWIRHADDNAAHMSVQKISPGLHMIAADDLDDTHTSRIATWFPRFHQARLPEPAQNDWESWRTLLASRDIPIGLDGHAAMNIDYQGRFGTVCSQLLAIPRYPGFNEKIRFLFAPGAPDEVAFMAVE